MEYELRELKSSDMGQVCKIIKAIGIKEFKESFNVDDIKGGNVEAVGFEVMFGIATTVIENIPKAQKDIDSFLASITGMKVAEIQDMNLGDYGDLIVQVVGKKEFKDFFSHAMKLFNL